MKANEAPEKIYIHPDNDVIGEVLSQKVEGDIEYIQTHVFIEKACDAYCKVCGHYPHTTPNHICRQACDYYEDFKNYMKG